MLEVLRPDRIGHGILAAGDDELMRSLREPRSGARDLPHLEPPDEGAGGRGWRPGGLPDLRGERRPLHDRDRRARDDGSHLRHEFELLLRIGALTREEVDEANMRGHEASFLRGSFRSARV